MQTFLPVADFDDERPAAGLPAAGQAAGRDPADPAGDRAARLRLGQPPRRPHVARPHAGAGRLRAGDGPDLAGARLRRHHRDARSASSRPRSSGVPQAELAAAGLLPIVGRRRGAAPLAPVQPDRQGPRLLPAALRRAVRRRARRPALRLARSRTTSPPAPAPEGVRVWVVRPRAHDELGACLAAGVVGLGTQSGIDVDATGLSPAELRALSKELSGRRPAKDLRQLSAFLDEMRAGRPGGAADRARRRAAARRGRRATTCSRAASCCRTAVRPAGTGWCRGRRPARRPRCRTRARCSRSSSTRRSLRLAAAGQRHVLQPHLARGRPACRRRRG